MALCNPLLKDYMKGRKCLWVHDVAMSSLRWFFTPTPPSRPSLGPHAPPPPPAEGSCCAPAGSQTQTCSDNLNQSASLALGCDSGLWLSGRRNRVHARAAEPRRRTEGCPVLLCEFSTRLHGPVSGSTEHWGLDATAGTPVCKSGRQRSSLVVCARKVLSWGSLRKREGSSPHFWRGRETEVESCSVLSAAWAGREGFYRRPTWAGDRSILSARGASEGCTDIGCLRGKCSSFSFPDTCYRITDFSLWVSCNSCWLSEYLGLVYSCFSLSLFLTVIRELYWFYTSLLSGDLQLHNLHLRDNVCYS